jgi:hypothetical protein
MTTCSRGAPAAATAAAAASACRSTSAVRAAIQAVQLRRWWASESCSRAATESGTQRPATVADTGSVKSGAPVAGWRTVSAARARHSATWGAGVGGDGGRRRSGGGAAVCSGRPRVRGCPQPLGRPRPTRTPAPPAAWPPAWRPRPHHQPGALDLGQRVPRSLALGVTGGVGGGVRWQRGRRGACRVGRAAGRSRRHGDLLLRLPRPVWGRAGWRRGGRLSGGGGERLGKGEGKWRLCIVDRLPNRSALNP